MDGIETGPQYNPMTGKMEGIAPPLQISRYLSEMAGRGKIVDITDPNTWDHMGQISEELKTKYGLSQHELAKIESKANLQALFRLSEDEADEAFDYLRGQTGIDNGLGQSVNEFANNLKKSATASAIQYKLGPLYFNYMMGDFFGDQEKTLERIQRLEDQMPQDYNGSWLQNASNALVSLIPQMAARWKKALPVAVMSGVVTGGMGLATGLGAIPMAGGGFIAGLAGGSIEAQAEILAGLRYRELLKIKDADGNPLKADFMKRQALVIGGIQALLEVPSQLMGLKFIPGIAGALQAGSKEIVKKGFTRMVNSAATKSKLEALANVVRQGSAEGFEEFSQGITEMIADAVAIEAVNKAARDGAEVDYSMVEGLSQAFYDATIGFAIGVTAAGGGQLLVNRVDRHGKVLDTEKVAKKQGVEGVDIQPFQVDKAGVESDQVIRQHRYVNNERAKDFNRFEKYAVDAETAKYISDPYILRVVAENKNKQERAANLFSREKERLEMVTYDALSEEGKLRFEREVTDIQFVNADGSLKPFGDSVESTAVTNDEYNRVGFSHDTVTIDRGEIAHYLGKKETDPNVQRVYNTIRKKAADGKFDIAIVRKDAELYLDQYIKKNEDVLFFKDKENLNPKAKPKDKLKYLIKDFLPFATEQKEKGFSRAEIVDQYNKKIKTENSLLSGDYYLHDNVEIYAIDEKTDETYSLKKKINDLYDMRKMKEEEVQEAMVRQEVTYESVVGKTPEGYKLDPVDLPVETKQKPTVGENDQLSAALTKAQREDTQHRLRLWQKRFEERAGERKSYNALAEVSEQTYESMEHLIDEKVKFNEIQKQIFREDPYIKNMKKQSKALIVAFDRIGELFFREERNSKMLEFRDDITADLEALYGTKYDKEHFSDARSILLYIEAKNLDPDIVQTIQNSPKAKEWYDKAMSITDKEKTIADKVQKRMKEMVDQAQANNVIDWTVDDYVPHYWKITDRKDRPGRKPGSSPSFSPFSTHNISRKYDTIFEGLMANEEFAYADPMADLFAYSRDMQASMAAKDMINAGLQIRDISNNPFFSRTKLENYAEINHKSFVADTAVPDTPWESVRNNSAYHWRQIGEDKRMVFREDKLYAPVEVAKFIDDAFGESAIKGNRIVDIITIGNSLRKAFRLTMSAFHAMSFNWQWFAGVQGNKYKKELGGLNTWKAYRSGLQAMNIRNEDVMLLLDNGMTYDMNNDYILETNAKKFVKKLKGPLKVFKPFFRATDWYNNWLFNRFGSGLKISAGLVELQHLREKYGWFDQNALARAVSQHMNNDFGGLDLRRMGRNQTLQHIFKLLVMAPDWNESNTRTMGSLLGKYDPFGTARNRNISGKNPLMKELANRMYLGGFMKLAAINLTTNFLTAAMEADEKEFLGIIDTMVDNYKLAWESGNLNWLKTDITPVYDALGINRDDNKRRYYSFGRHWLDFVKWTTDAPGTGESKMSFFVKDLGTLMTGTIFGAMELTTIGDLVEEGKFMKWGGARDATSQWELFPSFVVYSLFNVAPAQFEHILNYALGKQEWLDMVMNVTGLGVSKGEEVIW